MKITRRDYLNGILIGSGAALLRAAAPQPAAADFDGYSGTGDYSGSNGNTWAVMRDGHTLRDQTLDVSARSIIDTGEQFDCIVVGGGISGLAASLLHQRATNNRRTCLVLENHAIFGGLAKRNEMVVGGTRLIGNQASAMFFPPFPGTFFHQFYSSLGIEPGGWKYQAWQPSEPEVEVGQTPYFSGGPNSAFFFGPRFGQPGGRIVKNPWGSKLADAPISPETREELLRAHTGAEELPKQHGDARSRYMDTITLEQFLMETRHISRETVRTFLSPVAGGGAGIGADVLSAYAEYAADVLLPWDQAKDVQMFPGGNAGVARHLVKAVNPAALSGDRTMQGVCRGRVNFNALDRANLPVRIRLGCTVASVRRLPQGGVAVIYLHEGKLYRVRARSAVVAGGSWTARHIIEELPDTHRAAYAQFHRSPCLVANVGLRNWRFLYRHGLSECQWFEGLGNYTALRRLATFGDVAPAISPDSPVFLTLKILFSFPPLSLEEQNRRGREELLSTSYRQYEEKIRAQLQMVFAPLGFEADRDIAAIILNRWGHAYLSAQPGFFFGTASQPAPGEVLRNHPFGPIVFANSDLSGIMDHRASILEAKRAVDQLRDI